MGEADEKQAKLDRVPGGQGLLSRLSVPHFPGVRGTAGAQETPVGCSKPGIALGSGRMPGSPYAAPCCTTAPPRARPCSPRRGPQVQAPFFDPSTPRGPGPAAPEELASCCGISRTGCLGPFGASISAPTRCVGSEQEGSQAGGAQRRRRDKRAAQLGLPLFCMVDTLW